MPPIILRLPTGLRWAATSAVLLGAAFALAACDGDDGAEGGETPAADETPSAANTVDVGLTEFVVNPAQDTVDAGTVTFSVSNDGTEDHSFRVIKTDLAPDALPTAAGRVDEAQVDIVANIQQFAPGPAQQVSPDLEAGSYVLICNVSGHYDLGMRVAFTVE